MQRYLTPLLCCLLLACPARAERIELQMYTEEYAPVTFLRDGVADGMATEVVRTLLQRLGEAADLQRAGLRPALEGGEGVRGAGGQQQEQSGGASPHRQG